MKIFSRDFTLREKILLLVLVLFLVGLAYYQFVDQPVRSAIESARMQENVLSEELSAIQMKIDKLENMKNELDGILTSGTIGKMGSYNSSKDEMKMLNDILDAADKYSISFADVTRTGDQIRRNFSLQYITSDYDTAIGILSRLTNGEYRCLLSDVGCNINRSDGFNEQVSVNVTGTFYETMVGGTPDAGLPEDSAVQENQTDGTTEEIP